jgi:hypothetical protein
MGQTAFNQVIHFDENRLWSYVTQSAAISMSLGRTTVQGGEYVVTIIPDGVHTLSVDNTTNGFTVMGSLSQTQTNQLFFYNNPAPYAPSCKILNLPILATGQAVKSYIFNNTYSNPVWLSDADTGLRFGGDVPFSLMAWIKIRSAGIFNVIFSSGDGTHTGYLFFVDTSNFLNFQVIDVNGNYIAKKTVVTVQPNQWVHVAQTYTGTKTSPNSINLYINSIQQTSAVTSSGGSVATIYASGSITLGTNIQDNFFGDFAITHAAFSTASLSQAQINTAYNSGSGFDYTTATFAPSLIGYYKFNNNLNDSSINGSHTGAATSSLYYANIP